MRFLAYVIHGQVIPVNVAASVILSVNVISFVILWIIQQGLHAVPFVDFFQEGPIIGYIS